MNKLVCITFVIYLLITSSAFGEKPGYLSRYETDYTIYDLGLIQGGTTSIAYSVNNNMTVAGDAANGTGQQHSFVYENGEMKLINGTTGFSKAKAINDAGQVVGYRDTGSGTQTFVYQNGSMENLGSLGGQNSYAHGVNSWGMAVGLSETASGEKHAFVYDGISMQDIGTLGGNFSIAKDISDLGGVVGYSTTASGNDHAFVYSAGTGHTKDLGTLGGDNSYGNSINRFGHAVGYSETASGDSRAFYYDGEEMKDLGTLGGENSFANSINEFGFVVGNSETAEGEFHAYVYHENAFWYNGTTIIDLNDFIPEGSDWECITNAYDINEWGQIVGVGTIDGEMHAFLMNPNGVNMATVPLPGTILLFGSCITLCGIYRRRKI